MGKTDKDTDYFTLAINAHEVSNILYEVVVIQLHQINNLESKLRLLN